MSVWSMAQIEQARGLRAAAHVSREVLARYRNDAMAETKNHLAREIKHFAHPFAIEIEPADLRFREVKPEEEWEPIEVRCWWEPRTEEVELRGGEVDGAIYVVRGAPHEPLMMAQSPAINWLEPSEEVEPVAPSPPPLRFECSGWDESARRWIYSEA